MKKKLLTVVLAATMIISSAYTALAADIETNLIGKFSFEDNLTNGAGGADATPVAKTMKEATDTTATYDAGIAGKAYVLNGTNKDAAGFEHGLNLNVNPAAQEYTFAAWVKVTETIFADPIIWFGVKGQPSGGENWVGIWPGLVGDFKKGPALGSNDASDTRLGAVPVVGAGDITGENGGKLFDWLHVAITVKAGVGTLYYNGVKISTTIDADPAALLPDARQDASSVYIGANAWDAPFSGSIDEVMIYERALSDEDMKALFDSYGTDKAPISQVPLDTTEGFTVKPSKAGDASSYSYLQVEEEESWLEANLTIIIIAAVVVVLVIVVVIIAISSKKKANKNNSTGNDVENK